MMSDLLVRTAFFLLTSFVSGHILVKYVLNVKKG